MPVKYKDNTKEYIQKLKKVHGGIPIASANTVNTAADVVKKTYQRKLDQFTLRNKFTRGAVAILKSKSKRSKGGFRQIKDINAIVGVRKLKGGKDHYLLDQEKGGVKPGSRDTMGFVAMPMDTARTGKSHRKPIKTALRLQNVSQIQTLHVAGEPIGVPGSKFKDRQSWAIFHKYAGTGRGKNKGTNRYGWNLAKQFFFTGLQQGLSGLGVFKKVGAKAVMTRSLGGKSIRIKARHKFEQAFDKLSPKMMAAIFKREVGKLIRK